MLITFPLPDFLRHPDDTFECRVCPMRNGKARVMKDHNAREHVGSAVHQRFSRAALRGTVRMPTLAGPTASEVMGEVWRPWSVRLVRIYIVYRS